MREKRNLVFEKNKGLVYSIIFKKYKNHKDQEDLLQVGFIGLIKAIDTFDDFKGIQFSTYATRCILNELYTYTLKDSAVKIPNRVHHPEITISTISIDKKVISLEGEKDITLKDTIMDNDGINDYIEKEGIMQPIKAYIKNITNESHKNLMSDFIDLYLKTGKKNVDVLAKKYNLSTSRTNTIINEHLLALRKVF